MELGFALFNALEARGITTHEVFPSASYAMLEGENHLPVSLNFSTFRPGAKDMIDACIAAFTVAEFENGRGCEVGSHGLGAIVLPRPLPGSVPPTLLRWPTLESSFEEALKANKPR
jgi:predicted nuclease with RNAse H fold